MYKIFNSNFAGVNVEMIFHKEEKVWIPKDSANRHYQEYLEWVADGGVPEPADTPEEAE